MHSRTVVEELAVLLVRAGVAQNPIVKCLDVRVDADNDRVLMLGTTEGSAHAAFIVRFDTTTLAPTALLAYATNILGEGYKRVSGSSYNPAAQKWHIVLGTDGVVEFDVSPSADSVHTAISPVDFGNVTHVLAMHSTDNGTSWLGYAQVPRGSDTWRRHDATVRIAGGVATVLRVREVENGSRYVPFFGAMLASHDGSVVGVGIDGQKQDNQDEPPKWLRLAPSGKVTSDAFSAGRKTFLHAFVR